MASSAMADVPPPPARQEDEDKIEELLDDSSPPSAPPVQHAGQEQDLDRRYPSPPPPLIRHPALDLFPDGGFVRLRSRASRKYVHADEDWVGVSLGARGRAPSPLTAVWRVQHRVTAQGGVFLLLQGAAYGRYLAISPQEELPGHHGVRVVQRDLDQHNIPEYMEFRWSVERVDARRDYVSLFQYDRRLRANGRCCCTRNTAVTAESNFDEGRGITTMMQWTVHAVAASPAPIPQATIHGGRCRGLLCWRHQVSPHPPRTIWYVRANHEGEFNQNRHEWDSFPFHGHSLFNLRIEVALRQDDWDGGSISYITLCMWPGLDGRLIPLRTDLPRSGEPMYIVVLTTGSPAAEALVYPQILCTSILDEYKSRTSEFVSNHLFGNQKHLSTAAHDTVTLELAHSI